MSSFHPYLSFKWKSKAIKWNWNENPWSLSITRIYFHEIQCCVQWDCINLFAIKYFSFQTKQKRQTNHDHGWNVDWYIKMIRQFHFIFTKFWTAPFLSFARSYSSIPNRIKSVLMQINFYFHSFKLSPYKSLWLIEILNVHSIKE